MSEASPRHSAAPFRRLSAVLILGVVVGISAGQLRCTSSGSSAIHPWGTYNTCLTAEVDTCKALDGGCYLTSLKNSMKIGADLDSGTFYLYRNPDAPVLGRQTGTRFEVVMDTANGGLTETACGCAANVVETIWGELRTAAPEESLCSDAGIYECLPETDAGFLPESWLAEADSGVDASVIYKGLTAVAEDVLTAADGGADGGCPCLPCRVVYNISGTLSQ